MHNKFYNTISAYFSVIVNCLENADEKIKYSYFLLLLGNEVKFEEW